MSHTFINEPINQSIAHLSHVGVMRHIAKQLDKYIETNLDALDKKGEIDDYLELRDNLLLRIDRQCVKDTHAKLRAICQLREFERASQTQHTSLCLTAPEIRDGYIPGTRTPQQFKCGCVRQYYFQRHQYCTNTHGDPIVRHMYCDHHFKLKKQEIQLEQELYKVRCKLSDISNNSNR